MDDAAVVRRVKRIGNLPCDRDRFADGHRSAREALEQRAPFDELHHQELRCRDFLEIVERGDMRMTQAAKNLRFTPESSDAIRVERGCGQRLDRDITIQPRVARAIDLSHSAFAQLPEDAIRTDSITDVQRVPFLGLRRIS